MAGLVGYDSSDDESQTSHPAKESPKLTLKTAPVHDQTADVDTAKIGTINSPPLGDSRNQTAPAIGPVTESAVPLGPSLPPTDLSMEADDIRDDVPTSPYSANRAYMHDLTLPSVPNLNIPPSPPGSPPARASKSFEQFLALKRKGTHFNAKLEQSTALKNPSVTDKLMDFVGLDGHQQYETNLPLDLWNPMALPETAFVDKLRISRDKITKEREAKKASTRGFVDFAPSTTTSDTNASGSGGLAKADRSKSSWR